jgi:hypothetical protein
MRSRWSRRVPIPVPIFHTVRRSPDAHSLARSMHPVAELASRPPAESSLPERRHDRTAATAAAPSAACSPCGPTRPRLSQGWLRHSVARVPTRSPASAGTPCPKAQAGAPCSESEWRPSSLRMESARLPNCTSRASIWRQPRLPRLDQLAHSKYLVDLRLNRPKPANPASAIVAVRTGQPLPTLPWSSPPQAEIEITLLGSCRVPHPSRTCEGWDASRSHRAPAHASNPTPM